jgi:hypothetical protein
MSFYIFTAPLFKLVAKPGATVNLRGKINEIDYVKVPDMDINTTINTLLTSWSSANPGFEPYGETKIVNNEMIIQPFVKYESKLNDKFLPLFLEELRLIPQTGTAYNQALENFNELSKQQMITKSNIGIPNSNNVVPQVSSASSSATLGGRKRNKTKRNKTRRNKTKRNK